MTGRIKRSLLNGKDNITGFQTNLSERTRRVARRTDYYVHDNAWSMIAVSVGLAFAAGFLLSKGNQQAIADAVGSEIPNSRDKVKKLNSWEFLHSSIPLALFAWKAFLATRGSRRAEI